MQLLLSFLRSLLVEFGKDQNAAQDIHNQIWLTEVWIEDHQIDRLDRSPRQLGNIEPPGGPKAREAFSTTSTKTSNRNQKPNDGVLQRTQIQDVPRQIKYDQVCQVMGMLQDAVEEGYVALPFL